MGDLIDGKQEKIFKDVLLCKKDGLVTWKKNEIIISQNMMIIKPQSSEWRETSKPFEEIILDHNTFVTEPAKCSTCITDADIWAFGDPENTFITIVSKNKKGLKVTWHFLLNNSELQGKFYQSVCEAKRPIFHPNTKKCEICQKRFHLFNRQHHCRRCGLCICKSCSNHSECLPCMNLFTPQRICRQCMSKIIQNKAVLTVSKECLS
ncbi:hypothetical protein WA158_003691 [Blastocystis sp. Blastoise]